MKIARLQWVVMVALLLSTAIIMVKEQAAVRIKEASRAAPGFNVVQDASAPLIEEQPFYRDQRLSQALTKEVHAPTLAEGRNGTLHAFWYGGSREGGKDVAIYAADYDPVQAQWSNSRAVITRQQTQQELSRYIKKLGNPVVVQDQQERLLLFYVSVSIGGWAGSSINVKVSEDDGQTWGPAKRLITSPFFNVSTLVKGEPIHYQHGHIGIPAYHEFIGKFGELLAFDPAHGVFDKVRLSWGRSSLQPVTLVEDNTHAKTYLRFAGEEPHRILFTETFDAGATWSYPVKTALPNPNAAIAGLSLVDPTLGKILLMVYNNSLDHRNRLSLGASIDNGYTWEPLHDFDYAPDQPEQERYSYPYFIQTKDGRFHLLYTWNRLYIKHIEFNRAWLLAQVEQKIDPKLLKWRSKVQ